MKPLPPLPPPIHAHPGEADGALPGSRCGSTIVAAGGGLASTSRSHAATEKCVLWSKIGAPSISACEMSCVSGPSRHLPQCMPRSATMHAVICHNASHVPDTDALHGHGSRRAPPTRSLTLAAPIRAATVKGADPMRTRPTEGSPCGASATGTRRPAAMRAPPDDC